MSLGDNLLALKITYKILSYLLESNSLDASKPRSMDRWLIHVQYRLHRLERKYAHYLSAHDSYYHIEVGTAFLEILSCAKKYINNGAREYPRARLHSSKFFLLPYKHKSFYSIEQRGLVFYSVVNVHPYGLQSNYSKYDVLTSFSYVQIGT